MRPNSDAAAGVRSRTGHPRVVLTVFLLVGLLAFLGSMNPAAADHERSYDVTVNGQPLHGEGSPKLEGCTISVAISNATDDDHTVGISIALTEPSGSAVLATDQQDFTGTTWDGSYPLDAALADVEPRDHGHHLIVTVTLDGDVQESRPFWLLCGAEAGGNPFRVAFDKVWQTTDGEVLTSPPPDLDRTAYAIDVTSDRGTAHCAYPDGSDVLACDYNNTHGHEDETNALIIPAGKKFTFTVSEVGLPEGWEPTEGIGTFSPREVCPFDEEHEEEELTVEAHEGQREICEFVVVNVGDLPVPSTSTTASTTTTTTAPSGGVESETGSPDTAGAAVEGTTASTGVLPVTGSTRTAAIAGVALLLLAVGTVLTVSARRHRTP